MHKIMVCSVIFLSSCTYLANNPEIVEELEKDAIELEQQVFQGLPPKAPVNTTGSPK